MTAMFVTTSTESSSPGATNTMVSPQTEFQIATKDTQTNTFWVATQSGQGRSTQEGGMVLLQLDRSTTTLDANGDLIRVTEDYQPPAGPWTTQLQGSSATHQLIHGLPPAGQPIAPEDEVIDEEVGEDEEEEEEEGNVSDEGYRTHSSINGGSPPSLVATTPPPTVRLEPMPPHFQPGMKPIYPQQLTQEQQRFIQAARNGDDLGTGNSSLMWLLDFKLDFFNDPANGGNGQFYYPNQVPLGNQAMVHEIPQHQQQFLHIDTLDQPGHKDTPNTFVQPMLSPSHDVIVMTSQSPSQLTTKALSSPSLSSTASTLSPPIAIPSIPDVTCSSQDPMEALSIVPREDLIQSAEKSSPKEAERSSKKPPYTYTDLITQALKDKTALTVSGIYLWIIDKYPYFKAEDDRWKNSVRHNLSMNPHFRKGDKSKHGAGHLWIMADYDEDPDEPGVPAAQDYDEDEAARAVRSILGQEAANVAAEAASLQQCSSLADGSLRSEESNKENQVITRSQSIQESLQQTIADIKRKCMKRPHASEAPPRPSSTLPVARRSKRPKSNGSSIELRYIGAAKPGQHAQESYANHAAATVAQAPPQLVAPPAKRVLVVPVQPDPLVPPPTTFSPMEQIEDISYCYDQEDVTSIEKVLGIDFHEPANQRQLLAK